MTEPRYKDAATARLFELEDEDGFTYWEVWTASLDGEDLHGTRDGFATPGAALDWAMKWAQDRGGVLAIAGAGFTIRLKTGAQR